MILNYFKIAWRTLWNHKAYSLINIIGLSIGLTACLIVATVVIDELSYDRQWSKGDDLYRVLSAGGEVKGEEYQPVAFSGFASSLKKDFPEVEDYSRISISKQRLQLGKSPEGVSFMDMGCESSIWNMLDLKIISGNPKKHVDGYINIVISEKVKKQYFPHENPVGKVILTISDYGEKPKPALITGVIADIPQNTHLRADILNIANFHKYDGLPKKDEGYFFMPQYVLLKHGTSATAFTDKVQRWYAKQPYSKDIKYSFRFQPIKDVYLRSDFAGVQDIHGSIRNVYIFSGVAILLLLIACINFINLTISRIFNRSKETGIRKVLGANKTQLIIRFLSESLIFFIISFILAVILYPLFLTPVETYMGHPLTLNLYHSSFLAVTIAAVLLVSLLTGLYPAWFLSRPQPIVIMRNKTASSFQLNVLKKGLVVGQFVISVSIIIVALVVHNQLSFISNKDLGFNKNNLLNIPYTNWGAHGQAFKQQVKQFTGVENASISAWYPTSGKGDMSMLVQLPGQKELVNVNYIEGDADLSATLGLKLKNGRMLDPMLSSDAMDHDSSMNGKSAQTKALINAQPYLLSNYTAGVFNAKINTPVEKVAGIPVGILADFNSESLHSKISPTIIRALTNMSYGSMLIRVKPGYEKQVLGKLNTAYKSFYPDKPFSYAWVNELVDQQYQTEYKLQQLFTCFSALIIFLACLGLFGLVSFSTEQRVKEIGIRKVLGANVTDIVALISREYIGLVTIAVLVASPIAWYAMSKWLQDFAYRINIQWWVFVVTGVTALLIALITVSFQSVKAALANPVKSLRSE